MPDAVVIGAGPNGLVAANLLADEGWDVVVFEAAPEPGGAVRNGELTVPGFTHDLFSSFYPLAVAPASPIRHLDLGRYGLEWCHAPAVLAHAFGDGTAVVLGRDVEATAASVEAMGAGDGDRWRAMVAEWDLLGPPFMETLLRPFPPVAPAGRLALRLGRPSRLLDFTRFALLPMRTLARERFVGEGAAMLLAGNTLHTDLGPESAGGGLFGWLLAMLGQTVGFPAPRGGASALTAALVRRLEARGGQVRCGHPVVEVMVRGGRAVAVRLADGTEVEASRAVIAATAAAKLYLDLVGAQHLPAGFLRDVRRIELDHGTVKVDWALREPAPWRATEVRTAGTVHVGEGLDHLTEFAAQLSTGRRPTVPFCVFGQMTTTDPSRSPAGTETAWAYTHVPNGLPDAETAAVVDAIEEQVEARAPGFRDLVLGKHVFTPTSMEAADPNLIGGAVNGGTAQVHQQLVFRPTVGWGRPTTPVRSLYLGSASAHPGGGVHGACGANAAAAALGYRRLLRRVRVGSRAEPGATPPPARK